MTTTQKTPIARSSAQNQQPASPAQLVQIAIQAGSGIEVIERLLQHEVRAEEREARKAYLRAMTAFKSHLPEIVKDKTGLVQDPESGEWTEYAYASLGNVVSAIAPALAEHGLTSAWKPRQSNGGAVEVTCIVSHVDGHSESVALSATPDFSGGKIDAQATAATVTLLERYTILAACGIAAVDQDTDGAAPGPRQRVEAPRSEEHDPLFGMAPARDTSGKPPLPQEEIDGNADDLRGAGNDVADSVIARMRQRFYVSDEQEQKLRALCGNEGAQA
jgi:hypothetical protein